MPLIPDLAYGADTRRHKLTGDVHLLMLDGDGQVLFGRRQNTGFEDGAWHLPSGHLEAGESVVAALVREAKEEIGIRSTSSSSTSCTTHPAAAAPPVLQLPLALGDGPLLPAGQARRVVVDRTWRGGGSPELDRVCFPGGIGRMVQAVVVIVYWAGVGSDAQGSGPVACRRGRDSGRLLGRLAGASITDSPSLGRV
jgi:hypothetical protein